jgi:hypothetical protein
LSHPALYAHPILALATVALAVRAARLGLQGRRPGGNREALRRQHRRLAGWTWILVVGNWIGGLVVVRALRPDLDVAASGHFALGSLIAILLTTAAVVSRWVPHHRVAAAVHPVLGAVAVVLAGVQVFLGLQLLP